MLDLKDLNLEQLKKLEAGEQLDLKDLQLDQLKRLEQLQYEQDKKKSPYNFGPPGNSQLDITNPFGADDSIDNTTGVQNFDFRSNFAEQDNEEERLAYLEKKVGKDGFSKDRRGRYFLTDIGLKKIGEDPLVEGKRGRLIDADLGFFKNLNPMNPDFIYDLAELKSSIGLPLLGAIGASVATGGMATIPAMAMVGLGGGVGKALDEFVFKGEDMQLSNPAKDIAYETLLSAGGEGFGRALRGIYRYLFAPGQRVTSQNLFSRFRNAKEGLEEQGYEKSFLTYRKFDPKLPIAQGLAQDAVDRGGLPSILQATDRPLLGRFQGMFDTIFGNPREYYNQRFMNNEMTKLILRSRGVNVVEKASSELANLTKYGPRNAFGRPSKALEEYSAKLQQLARETFGEGQYNELFKNEFVNPEFLFKTYREGGENAFEAFKSNLDSSLLGKREAEKKVNELLKDLLETQLPAKSPKITANDVLKNAQQAFANWQKESSVLYSRVDKAFGDEGIVNAMPLRQMLHYEQVKGNIFADDRAVQTIMRYLNNESNMLTYFQANTLRQYIDELAFMDNPAAAGIPKSILARASKLVNDGIQNSPLSRQKYINNIGKNKVISDWLTTNPRLLSENLDRATNQKILKILQRGASGPEELASKRFTDLTRADQNEIFRIVKNNIEQYDDEFLNEGFNKVLQRAIGEKKNLNKALELKSLADDFYESNKFKFDKGLANQLIKQTTQRGAIDPSNLSKLVLQNKPDDLLRVLKQVKFGEGKPFEKILNKMGGPLTATEKKTLSQPKKLLKVEAERLDLTPGRELVRKPLSSLEADKTRLFMSNALVTEVMNRSRNAATNGITSRTFYNTLRKFGEATGSKTPSTLEIVMGKKEAARLLALSKDIARNTDMIDEGVFNKIFTGKLANKEITNIDDILTAFNDELAKVKNYSEFETFIGDLTKPGMEGRQAINYLFSENNIKKFTRVEQFLKETGQQKQIEGIRRAGVSKLLEQVVDSTSSVSDGVLLNGQKLLNKIDDLGGQDSLETFFGKELGKELFDFANQATFLGQKATLSGGLVAASIALNPLQKAPLLVQMNVMSRLMGSRSFMNLLNRGIRAGNARDIAEISRIVGIQTQALMKDAEDSGMLDQLSLKPNVPDQTMPMPSTPQVQPETMPTQPQQQVPNISMFAEQSIPDKIEELFPEDELSKAIARRQTAGGPNA